VTGFLVLYRVMGSSFWHRDGQPQATRELAEARAADLIRSGLEVRIKEVEQ